LEESLKSQGYTTISYNEWRRIEKESRKKYIEKFGVDPAKPKIDIVNGIPLPSEYVKEMVRKGILFLREMHKVYGDIQGLWE
jgi:hypothetical protein